MSCSPVELSDNDVVFGSRITLFGYCNSDLDLEVKATRMRLDLEMNGTRIRKIVPMDP